jgi:hypothetical protein
MPETAALKANAIPLWIAEKWDLQKVEESLRSSGNSDEVILTVVREFKKQKQAKRNTVGFIYLGTGAFIGFLSCLFSLINPIPELLNWFLYGFTCVAMVFLGWGLYMIFEGE